MSQFLWPAAVLAAGLAVLALCLVWLRKQPKRSSQGWCRVLQRLALATPPRVLALIGAGPPLTLFLWWLVDRIMSPSWPVGLRELQLKTVGGVAYGLVGLILVILVALAAINVSLESKVANFKIDGDGDDAKP